MNVSYFVVLSLVVLGWLEIVDEARADGPDPIPKYSIWMFESGRQLEVPMASFLPGRAYIPGSKEPNHNVAFVDLPNNVGLVHGNGHLVLYDTGAQYSISKKPGTFINWAPISAQLNELGFRPEDVTDVVLGNAHWDKAGQLDQFPNAKLYVQQEELRTMEWALNYPKGRTSSQEDGEDCARTSFCGYSPKTVDQIFAKVLKGKAIIFNGKLEIAPGLTILPAHRAHTGGSQLLQVNTNLGPVLFGGGAYSSWEGIKQWEVANLRQTDTMQQILAYEECYRITGGYDRCLSGYDPNSYTSKYPITQASWRGPNGSRFSEVALAPGEKSRREQKGMNDIPTFQWPPRTPSTSMVLPGALMNRRGKVPATLGEFDLHLREALEKAGYIERAYYAVPDGFALITRVEQIDEDGTSKTPRKWGFELIREREWNWTSFLSNFLHAPAGHFRVVAFVVTTKEFGSVHEKVTKTEALEWLSKGLNKLPMSIASTHFTIETLCTALVYEFKIERLTASDGKDPESAETVKLVEGGITAKDHLSKAALWVALEKD